MAGAAAPPRLRRPPTGGCQTPGRRPAGRPWADPVDTRPPPPPAVGGGGRRGERRGRGVAPRPRLPGRSPSHSPGAGGRAAGSSQMGTPWPPPPFSPPPFFFFFLRRPPPLWRRLLPRWGRGGGGAREGPRGRQWWWGGTVSDGAGTPAGECATTAACATGGGWGAPWVCRVSHIASALPLFIFVVVVSASQRPPLGGGTGWRARETARDAQRLATGGLRVGRCRHTHRDGLVVKGGRQRDGIKQQRHNNNE